MVRASKTMGVDPEVVLQGDTTQGVWGLEGPLRTLGTTFKSSAQKRRDRVLKMIREGIDLPWATDMPDNLRDPATGGCPKNVNLKAASERVWDTLYEQLVEKAVLPWNCFNRDDVDVLPLGMFPIFWTTKAGTSKIRIIIDL